MSEADTSPRLNVAPVDPLTSYAPISNLTVASLVVAGLLVVLLLALGAMSKNRVLDEPWLIGLALMGIVVAFAARRQIANSEGTLKGIPGANAAWWICIVCGLGYTTYLFTIDWTIRGDADRAFMAWSEQLKQADPSDLDNPAFLKSAYLVLSPELRVSAGNDFAKLEQKELVQLKDKFSSAPEFIAFRNNELFPILRRNADRVQFVPQGMKNRKQTSGRIECELSVTLKTPEGEFPMSVPMLAIVDTSNRRQWQILRAENYVQTNSKGDLAPKLTKYGWAIRRLEDTAVSTARDFIFTSNGRIALQPDTNMGRFTMAGTQAPQRIAYDIYTAQTLPRNTGERILETSFFRSAVAGTLGIFWKGDPSFADSINSLFLTGMKGATLSEDERRKFKNLLENQHEGRLQIAGQSSLQGFPDKHVQFRITPNKIEVYVPLEVKPNDALDAFSAARGNIVLVLNDPVLVAEILKYRDGDGTILANSPAEIANKEIPWKVERIESDLKVKSYRPAQPGGGPPGSG